MDVIFRYIWDMQAALQSEVVMIGRLCGEMTDRDLRIHTWYPD